jgi:hypothetical protein
MSNHEDAKNTIPEDVEKLAYDVIGCCVRVHRELGPGLLETIATRQRLSR